jgi:hypothetical protein
MVAAVQRRERKWLENQEHQSALDETRGGLFPRGEYEVGDDAVHADQNHDSQAECIGSFVLKPPLLEKYFY